MIERAGTPLTQFELVASAKPGGGYQPLAWPVGVQENSRDRTGWRPDSAAPSRLAPSPQRLRHPGQLPVMRGWSLTVRNRAIGAWKKANAKEREVAKGPAPDRLDNALPPR